MIDESNYYTEIPDVVNEAYASVYLINLRKEYLSTLDLGRHEVKVVTTDNRTLTMNLDVEDYNRITLNFKIGEGSGYFDYENYTTGQKGQIGDGESMVVRRGDKMKIHPRPNEGYQTAHMLLRNGLTVGFILSDEFEAGQYTQTTTYEAFFKLDSQYLEVTPGSLDFGTAAPGYEPINAQGAKILSAGNSGIVLLDFNLLYPFETEHFIFSPFDCDAYVPSGYPEKISLGNRNSCTFTVKPKEGLAPGVYNDIIPFHHKHVTDLQAQTYERVYVGEINLKFIVKEPDIASLNLSTLDFGELELGYGPDTAKQLEIENTSDFDLVIRPMTSKYFNIGEIDCGNAQTNGNKNLIPVGAKCKFDINPKEGLEIGKYAETINIYNDAVSTFTTDDGAVADIPIASIDLKLVVKEAIPKVSINFQYSNKDAAYITYTNETTGASGRVDDQIIVNKGDEITICANENPGYVIKNFKRNGIFLDGKCDSIVADEDLNYYLIAVKNGKELTVDPENLDFGNKIVGYNQVDEMKFTLKNTGSEFVNLDLFEAKNYDITPLKCHEASVDTYNILLVSDAYCEFSVKPKNNLGIGDYAETIDFYEYRFSSDTVPNKVGSLNLKFAVNEELPQLFNLNFNYNIKDSAYISYENQTTHEKGKVVDKLVVNEGDTVTVCAYSNDGYILKGMKRNGAQLGSRCDTITASEDINYDISTVERITELTVNPTSLDFGSIEEGYKAVTAKDVLLTNSGTDNINLKDFNSENFIISTLECDNAFDGVDNTYMYSGSKCKFSVKPKDNLVPGNYTETINFYAKEEAGQLSSENDILGSLKLNFVVEAKDVVDPDNNKPDGNKPDGDKPDGNKPDVDNPDVDNPDSGNKPDGNNPDGNKPDGNKPDGNKPDVDNPDSGNKPDGNKPDGNKPDVDNPDSGNKPDGNNPDGNKPDVDNPDSGNKPDVDNPDVDNPDTDNKPDIDNPDSGNKPDGNKPDGNKPDTGDVVDPDKEEKPEKDDVPQTNDESHVMLYGAISASTLGLAIYLDKKRKATK